MLQKYFKSILKKKFEAETDEKMRKDGLVFIRYVMILAASDTNTSQKGHAKAVELVHSAPHLAFFTPRRQD